MFAVYRFGYGLGFGKLAHDGNACGFNLLLREGGAIMDQKGKAFLSLARGAIGYKYGSNFKADHDHGADIYLVGLNIGKSAKLYVWAVFEAGDHDGFAL